MRLPTLRLGLLFAWTLMCLTVGICGPGRAEKIFFAGYKGGFYIQSEEEGGMALRLGGAFQTDYRFYLEDERADNRFDIRRARLLFRGRLTRWFRYGMEFEFQGNETDNIVEAYAKGVYGPHALKMGQYKAPFSLEWQTRDKGLFFAERSMLYSLGPKRDIGLMLHGGVHYDTVNYAVGLFNGDGGDGATRGNAHDEPELAARLVLAPFKASGNPSIRQLQFGASATYADIDLANVDLAVKSTGMAGSNRSLYVLSHDTKFGVLRDVDTRQRIGLEAAWAWGPLLLQGEAASLKYTGMKPSGDPRMDAAFSAWYLSAVWCLTGEQQILRQGVVKPIYPRAFFDPAAGTLGAFCLAARLEHFNGDDDWINSSAKVSVREAESLSLALNWILFPMVRLIFDYSHTDFSDPLRVRVLPDGSVDYIESENVFTCRFSMDF